MKIIDWAKKGNIVRFFYGKDDCKDFWGDDWNDAPYEHNAGEVYCEFVYGFMDVAFPYDWHVTEPAEDWHYNGNSPFCKEDFINRNAPCVIAIPFEVWNEDGDTWDDGCYSQWVGSDNIYKFYFGDPVGKIYTMVSENETLYPPVIIANINRDIKKEIDDATN